MRRIILYAALVLLPPSAHAASLPGDSAAGKRLYEVNCVECHDSSVFTRKDRHVQSLDGLEQQVANCTHMAKKDFSAGGTQDLLKYLNDQFYHFN